MVFQCPNLSHVQRRESENVVDLFVTWLNMVQPIHSSSLCYTTGVCKNNFFYGKRKRDNDANMADELIQTVQNFRGTCETIVAQNRRLENNVEDALILFKNRTNDCYFCYEFIVRSPNVLQYRRSKCSCSLSNNNLTLNCEQSSLFGIMTKLEISPSQLISISYRVYFELPTI
ncbi:hypothetical protein FGIG_12156 [Fasciola gigantica]|uniref:DUF7044 domain-containing protein n=1 Tax=Fasciola gigantica TaxID=46835 RepID=A0A504YGT3_FASGI|nr:hypothetical protein FGIG_12156 [Fasciola gigantica]